MKIKVLGAGGSRVKNFLCPSFLLNEAILLDAGTILEGLDLSKAHKISSIFLSHAHLDHVMGLPFFLEYLASSEEDPSPVKVYALKETIETIKDSLFNNQLWPDFSVLPSTKRPLLEFYPVDFYKSYSIKGYEIMPIPTDHIIPSAGYLISKDQQTFFYSGDTGAGGIPWKDLFSKKKIQFIILECTFPNRKLDLAYKSKHLTPTLIKKELEEIPPDCKIYIFHLKPHYYNEIKRELREIKREIHLLKDGDIIVY